VRVRSTSVPSLRANGVRERYRPPGQHISRDVTATTGRGPGCCRSFANVGVTSGYLHVVVDDEEVVGDLFGGVK
jgi:hypothetical protein